MKLSRYIAILLSGALLAGCSSSSEPVRFTGYAMGTVVNETIYTDGDDPSASIETEIASLENQYLSNKVDKAEISRINAGSTSISGELKEYITTLLKVSEDSNGAFDPTIGALSSLWDFDDDTHRIPADSSIKELLSTCGYEKLVLGEDTISIPDGMKLDLGAAGKGIALDKAAQLLEDCEGVTGAVISVGESSILTYGDNPNRDYWQIDLRDPRDKESLIGTLKIKGTCYIGTSGDYQKFFEKDGVRYHHILDRSTGYPADSDVTSVTIVSDSGILCDALSTACFVLGSRDGKALAEKYGADAIFIGKNGKITMTDGAKSIFEKY